MKITTIVLVVFYFACSPSKKVVQNEGEKDKKLTTTSINGFPLVEELANALLQKTNLPGFSIAVSKNDQIIYANGFGYANVETKEQMNPTTQLRTASVSKVITITAIGKLMSEGKLDIDIPIKKYVPYINKMYANLTVRQLAGHTSGMPHRPAGGKHKKQQFTEIKKSVELMDLPLLFQPDSEYKYSTHAFNVLAAVIEGSSGKSFIHYMNDEIFQPLKMNQTFSENIKSLSEKDAKIYYLKKGKRKKERLTNASYKLAGAGFRSTPTDLVKMMSAYTNGMISEETVRTMFESHQLKNGKKTNVGIAWRSSYDIYGNKVIEHAGHWRGARTVIVHFPKEHLNISIMINSNCQLLIEETAHLFAQLFRENNKSISPSKKLNKKVEMTFRPNNKEEKYNGSIMVENGQGVLAFDSDGFLKSNPIYYLGREDDYAIITTFGLLYLDLSSEASLKGELYFYSSRNETNPRNNKSLASIREIE